MASLLYTTGNLVAAAYLPLLVISLACTNINMLSMKSCAVCDLCNAKRSIKEVFASMQMVFFCFLLTKNLCQKADKHKSKRIESNKANK